MNTHDLKNLTKSQLISLLIKQNLEITKLLQQNMQQQPIPTPITEKPIPAPRKSVKQMVQNYEDNIIQTPLEFRDDYKPIPAPRRSVKQNYEENIIQPVPLPRTKKPTPLIRTKIEEIDKAMKGYTKSFKIGIKYDKDPSLQLQSTRKAIEYHIKNILKSMKGLKFVETLKVTFTKMSNKKIVYKTAYFNSKAQTIINNTEIPSVFSIIKTANLKHDSSMDIRRFWLDH